MMQIRAYGMTDVGRKRDHNEDAFLMNDQCGIFLVADGMGGHQSGDLASSTAVELIHRELCSRLEEIRIRLASGTVEERQLAFDAISHAFETACHEIHRLGQRNGGQKGMGTTAVALLFCDNLAVVAHVGDSRAYMLRGGVAHQLTEDHSLVQEQVKRGLLSPEDAKVSPYANIITRALGIQETAQPDILFVELSPGDEFLLCTDGFHGYLREGELEVLLEAPDQETAVRGCIELANESGGKDNITVIDVRVLAESSQHESLQPSEKIEALRAVPLFAELEYPELMRLLGIVSLVNVEAEAVIVAEGEVGEECFILLEGEVQVTRGGQEVACLQPVQHFGEMALVEREPLNATAVALTPARLLAIHQKDFLQLIRKEPALGVQLLWSFLERVSTRLRTTSRELAELRAAYLRRAR